MNVSWLIYADLRRANLCETRLIYADLSDANLRQAELNETDLSGANLRGLMYVRPSWSG